jgi:hypothetical protein
MFLLSPGGTAEVQHFSRPSRTVVIVNAIPGTEVPGYFHGVPLGRESRRSGPVLRLTSGNVSTTNDEEADN